VSYLAATNVTARLPRTSFFLVASYDMQEDAAGPKPKKPFLKNLGFYQPWAGVKTE